MFASDVHGSAYYCRKMLDAYKEEEGRDAWYCWAICSIMAREMIFRREYAPKAGHLPCLNDMKKRNLCCTWEL